MSKKFTAIWSECKTCGENMDFWPDSKIVFGEVFLYCSEDCKENIRNEAKEG